MRRSWQWLVPLCALVYLWPVVMHPGHVLAPARSDFTDLLVTHWPNAMWLRRAVVEYHEWPLWNPAILAGQPFAADPLAGLWYPPNWLLLLPGLPLGFLFNLLFAAHLAWGGLGMYRFLRAPAAGEPSGMATGTPDPAGPGEMTALVGAVAFMGMPKLIGHLGAGHVSLYYAVSWTPWLMSSIRSAANEGGIRRGAVAGAVLAALFLADVRWAALAGLLGAFYWLWTHILGIDTLNSRIRGLRRLLAAFAAIIWFSALSAVLSLPLDEFRRLSQRAAITLDEASLYSLPARYLIGLLLPDLGGFHEWLTYLGILPVGLAIVATFGQGSGGMLVGRERWFWATAAGLAGLFSLGSSTPLFGLAYRVVPGFAWLRVPSRAWFLVGFAVSVLAAHGACHLMTPQAGRAGHRYNLVAVGVTAACWSLALGLWATTGRWLPGLVWTAVAATTGATLIALRAHERVSQVWFARLAAVIIILDLAWVDSTLVRTVPEQVAFAPGHESAEQLSLSTAGGVDFRVYSPSYSLPQHVASRYGLEMADGVNPLQLAATVDFMTKASGVPPTGYSVTVPPFPSGDPATANAAYTPDAALLGLLNVRYVAAEFDLHSEALSLVGQVDNTRLYENALARPRAWVAFEAYPVSDRAEALDLAAQGVTTVELAPSLTQPREWVEAVIVQRGANHLTVEADVDRLGLLVLAEVDYPGWRATVDGQPAPIVRVDGLLRGVYLPEGRHRVELRFAPQTVFVGAAITAAGLIALCVMLLAGRRAGVGQ
jgi:hypothetical protein